MTVESWNRQFILGKAHTPHFCHVFYVGTICQWQHILYPGILDTQSAAPAMPVDDSVALKMSSAASIGVKRSLAWPR